MAHGAAAPAGGRTVIGCWWAMDRHENGEIMGNRTMVLEELRGRSLEDVLREVVRRQEELMVRLPEGEMVAIKPSPRLRPLPVLDGFVPEGWKDAVCE